MISLTVVIDNPDLFKGMLLIGPLVKPSPESATPMKVQNGLPPKPCDNACTHITLDVHNVRSANFKCDVHNERCMMLPVGRCFLPRVSLQSHLHSKWEKCNRSGSVKMPKLYVTELKC